MEIDRRAFFASLGGAAAITAMDSEAKADALEEYMSEQLDNGAPSATSPDKKFPTVAELDAQIDTRTYRRGVGTLFANNGRNVKKLQPLPANPTLLDFFQYRFAPANHVLQSATRAMKTGMTEEIILACLLHDVVQSLIKPDHGWWGAQLFEPYISPKLPSRSGIIRRCASIPILQPAMNIRTSITEYSGKTTRRPRTSKPLTKCSKTTSGTWNHGW
jgi:hypothetical protein